MDSYQLACRKRRIKEWFLALIVCLSLPLLFVVYLIVEPFRKARG